MGMPEHGGPQAAAFARACESSPPPSLFNMLSSQARAFFMCVCSCSSPVTECHLQRVRVRGRTAG